MNFRGLKRAFIASVAEGEGTNESIVRLVHYVYDEHGNELFKFDPCPETKERELEK